MALLHMLSAQAGRTHIHALTVDHGLRPESAAEAMQVGAWVSGWPGVSHHVLTWRGRKPTTAIQEQARAKRYALMAEYCTGNGIGRLYLAHHRNDQAETFVFRLAKGSGLDGLAAMTEELPCAADAGIILVRPLLMTAKEDLLAYCRAHKIPYVNDPGNANDRYARVRLRRVMPLLAEEGLSEKRLAMTARRLARARDALDHYTDRFFKNAAQVDKGVVAFDIVKMTRVPEEIRLRAVRRALGILGADGYGPRLERLEDLLAGFFAGPRAGKGFTIGGFVFTPHARTGMLHVRSERAGPATGGGPRRKA